MPYAAWDAGVEEQRHPSISLLRRRKYKGKERKAMERSQSRDEWKNAKDKRKRRYELERREKVKLRKETRRKKKCERRKRREGKGERC